MKFPKKALGYAAVIMPLLLAVICLASVSMHHQQASPPTPMPQELVGEYSYDRENWFPLTEEADLSALKGDLYLRGHMRWEVPQEWEAYLYYYRNHIGVQMWMDGQQIHSNVIMAYEEIDTALLANVCAREWIQGPLFSVSEETLIEVHLHNPHRWGNEEAYRDFLSTLCVAPRGTHYLQMHLEEYGRLQRTIGGMLAIVSFLLLGAAAAAFTQRLPIRKTLIRLALLALFAGGYIALDTIDVSFQVQLNVLSTYMQLLCMMLAVFLMQQIISDALRGKLRTIAGCAVFVSSVFDSVLILLSFTGVMALYDALPYWAASQTILCPLFLVLCGIALGRRSGNRLVLLSGMLLFAAILLDISGFGFDIVRRSVCTKTVFVLVAAVHIVDSSRKLIQNYRSSIRATRLEKELEDSRIAIMLSQIRPHFLFNVLNTIYQLYDVEPQTAKDATLQFAEYLRSNMLTIENTEPILFEKEYSHIQTYLSLEKIRFGKKLEVVYDPQVTNFKLPPLTVQPLVENAVKHGVTKKRGGGTVTLSTRETADSIVITVADTGNGFDPEHIHDDGEPHVGIRNVRRRLQLMMNGTLTIESTPDMGTTAVITLPKKEAFISHEDHSR